MHQKDEKKPNLGNRAEVVRTKFRSDLIGLEKVGNYY
jgi:hypothetical protein